MLTCKVGEKMINTFEYSSEQIRKWSNKSVLKCPICDGDMIYRHGEFKIPHFAHKSGECDNILGEEPATEEHIQSIKDIYLRLKQIEKSDSNLSDISLEYWNSKTRQRSDISFIYKNQRYAIEVQCSPQATEFMERQRLYELSGIKVIWILGMDNYNNKTTDDYYKTKEIERQLIYDNSQLVFYYNYNNKTLRYLRENHVDALFDRKTTFDFKFNYIQIDDLEISILLAKKNNKQLQTLKDWINSYITENFTNIKKDYYFSQTDKDVLCYFEDEYRNKYIIDYIAGYMDGESYWELLDMYKKENIVPLIFLNHNFYKYAINKGVSLSQEYKYVGNYNHKRLNNFIRREMLFIGSDYICMINERHDIKIKSNSDMSKVVKPHLSIDYYIEEDIFKQYIKDKEKAIEQLKTVCLDTSENKIKPKIIESILISHGNEYENFALEDIIIKNKNIRNIADNELYAIETDVINKILNYDIYNDLYDLILNRVKKNHSKWLKEKIFYEDNLNNHTVLYNNFKQHIEKIFKNNKKIIVEYNLNFSLLVEGDRFDNLIYFKDNKDNKYIYYTTLNPLLHSDSMLEFSSYKTYRETRYILDDITSILVESSDEFYMYKDRNKILKVDYGLYTISKLVSFKEDYFELLNSKQINLFYKDKNNRKPINGIRYKYLKDFDFKKTTEDVERISTDLDKEETDCFVSIDKTKIYSLDRVTVIDNNNRELKNNIYNTLKPLIEICQKVKDEEIYLMLNPYYCKKEGLGYQPWIINDFIDGLYYLGITNVRNLIKGVYGD